MSKRFADATIAVLEARMSGELANLIARHGGRARCIPAVREVPPADAAQQALTLLHELHARHLDAVIFSTGVGASALLREIEQQGQLPELLDELKRVTIICRGPKPATVLKKYGLPIHISAREPHTTEELLDALDEIELRGQRVALLHYGERNTRLVTYLQERGASVAEFCLYEWQLPEDTSALSQLINDLCSGQVDALVLTSQVQVRHLFQLAEKAGQAQALTEALRQQVTVASIGPTCSEALQQYGVTPHVEPEHPRMGHLVKALSAYLERQNQALPRG
ncbi:uroporphyrinogen-III synthase [Thermogemmatispora sp.]|uniref:uroporphyrinogen-III synthase n=1 Tax=Thermogemmatispora sp. TaxID=1968838 RepID=UPI001DFE6900|nr:uroporphyrinogen-III synthase [Thermogemmatispora sp.]MBX5449466.1 uroporphyrinogen-III synthase [Thermogemmatispora sp.]